MLNRIGLLGTIIALLSSAPGCTDGRRLAAEVHKSDVLCEVRRISEGPELPGIWAVGQGGTRRMIVPNSESPVWSPDHTKFAFLRRDTVCVADISSGSLDTSIQATSMGWPVPSGMPYEPRRRLLWNPDSRRLAGWGWTMAPAVGAPDVLWSAVYVAGVPAFPPDHRVVGEVEAHVGMFGFLTQGIIVYEALSMPLGGGITDVRLRFWDEGKCAVIDGMQPSANDEWWCNPVVSADGRHVAFDRIRKNDLRRTVGVLEAGSKGLLRIDKLAGTACLHAIEWSPDGTKLLLIGSESRTGIGANWPLVAIWDSSAQVATAQPKIKQLPGTSV